MASRGSRSEKVKRIFQQFDTNRDGGLNREEMVSLVVAVNPRVKFSDEQINSILDVDRDFDALGLEFKSDDTNGISLASEASSSSIADERAAEPQKKQRTAAWAASPNHGIVFDDTWKLIDDLEILIKRLKAKQTKDGKLGPSAGRYIKLLRAIYIPSNGVSEMLELHGETDTSDQGLERKWAEMVELAGVGEDDRS